MILHPPIEPRPQYSATFYVASVQEFASTFVKKIELAPSAVDGYNMEGGKVELLIRDPKNEFFPGRVVGLNFDFDPPPKSPAMLRELNQEMRAARELGRLEMERAAGNVPGDARDRTDYELKHAIEPRDFYDRTPDPSAQNQARMEAEMRQRMTDAEPFKLVRREGVTVESAMENAMQQMNVAQTEEAIAQTENLSKLAEGRAAEIIDPQAAKPPDDAQPDDDGPDPWIVKDEQTHDPLAAITGDTEPVRGKWPYDAE